MKLTPRQRSLLSELTSPKRKNPNDPDVRELVELRLAEWLKNTSDILRITPKGLKALNDPNS